jgi:predicted transcriptional regulator
MQEATMKKPAAKPATKSIAFSIRLSPEARKALIKAGEAEERSAAWIAQRAVVQWLKEKGFLK